MPDDSRPQSSAARQDRFTGRRILVTGGSRGIAAAIVRALAREGASVAVNFSQAADSAAGRAQAADEIVAGIRGEGGTAVAVEADMAQPGEGRRLVRAASAAIGPIDGLVLSASVQRHVPFLQQSDDDLDIQFRVNLRANIEVLQAAIPPMAEAGYGRILTIGSIQEVAPSAEMPIYSLTKAALKNLVENLAVQTAAQGITVNNLAPGLIETDRNAHRRIDMGRWNELTRMANPLGRAGTPEDLVGIALQLLAPESAFVTGATIYATGGAHVPGAAAGGRHAGEAGSAPPPGASRSHETG